MTPDKVPTSASELRKRETVTIGARVDPRRTFRTGKDCGIGKYTSTSLAMNKAWQAAALTAATLLAWLRLLALDGPLARAEPKTLRPVNRTAGRFHSSAGLAVSAADRRAVRTMPIARPQQPYRQPDRHRNWTYGAQLPTQLLLAAALRVSAAGLECLCSYRDLVRHRNLRTPDIVRATERSERR